MSKRAIIFPSRSAVTVQGGDGAYFLSHLSSGTETPRFWIVVFSASLDQHVYFVFRVPDDYSANPTLKIQYSTDDITGAGPKIRWVVNVMCATEDVDDLDTAAADSDNTSDDAVPNAAGEMGECTISLTNNDSMAAGDLCILKVGRDGSHENDDCIGVGELWQCEFQYTT